MAIIAGSWLDKIIKKVRIVSRDPATQGEYTDDELRWVYVEPAMNTVFNALAKQSGRTVLSKLQFTLVNNRQYYQLPPHVRKVRRIGRMDSQGYVLQDIMPRSEFHARGPTWRVDGNCLELRPWPSDVRAYAEDGKLDVWYVPGACKLHHSSHDGVQSASVFELDSSPDFGNFENQENAYVGCTFRLFDNTGKVDFEAVIQEFDNSNNQVTLRIDMPSSYTPGTAYNYEILPPMPYDVWNPVALAAAKEIMSVNDNPGKYRLVERELYESLKTIRDAVKVAQGRVPQRFERDTWQNLDPMFLGFGD